MQKAGGVGDPAGLCIHRALSWCCVSMNILPKAGEQFAAQSGGSGNGEPGDKKKPVKVAERHQGSRRDEVAHGKSEV